MLLFSSLKPKCEGSYYLRLLNKPDLPMSNYGELFDPVFISNFHKLLVRAAVNQVAIDLGSCSCNSKKSCL